jgi:alkylhydroperoxidase/carboxymuconolactone decarboxylase family protein YurZ
MSTTLAAPAVNSEVITQLAFYTGWPNAFSTMPVAKDVFEKRPKATGSSAPR